MSDAVFVVDGQRVIATPHAAGPWNPGLMHGGAPSALMVWAAERIPSPEPMRVARLTSELLRPAPVGDLVLETEVLRQGRKIQLCQIRLKTAEGIEVCRGQVLKIRIDPSAAGAERLPLLDQPLPEACAPASTRENVLNSFGAGFEMRRAHGGFGEIGPGAWWFRRHLALVDGETASPAMLAAAVADFANGISSVLPFERWTFLNGDLTVNFARAPRGDWILNNAETWISADGAGLATTRLADRDGYFGTATQSLVIDAR